MLAPSSRFSNRARTGTRVPLKTHTPLTLSGTRSTALHSFQSSILHPTPSESCSQDLGRIATHMGRSGLIWRILCDATPAPIRSESSPPVPTNHSAHACPEDTLLP